jgi:hypothetical protein
MLRNPFSDVGPFMAAPLDFILSRGTSSKQPLERLRLVDLPWKSGEPISRRQAAASNRIGLLYPKAECRRVGL